MVSNRSISRLLMAFFGALVIGACGQIEEKTNDAPPPTIKKETIVVVQTGPLIDMKALLIKLEEKNVFMKDIGDYDLNGFEDIVYDVTKTDSLVSPYTGIIKYSTAGGFKKYITVNLAYQNDKWIYKQATFVYVNKEFWDKLKKPSSGAVELNQYFKSALENLYK